MANLSPEKSAMERLAAQGQPLCRGINFVDGQTVRLEDGTVLHYWGRRTDLDSAQAKIGLGFGRTSAPRADIQPRADHEKCYAYLFEHQGNKTVLEALEVVSCSESELVFRQTRISEVYP